MLEFYERESIKGNKNDNIHNNKRVKQLKYSLP